MKVNEIFGPTIQGEGKSVGKEVIFVRLAFCNLKCVWCDTPYTWKFSEHNQSTEVTSMVTDEVFNQVLALGNTKAVVISGGEPLLQQKALVELLARFKALSYWVEIETNGTIVPSDEVLRLVDQFNCSPKLSNSGNDASKAVKAVALSKLVAIGSTFKFVYTDSKDGEEICQLVKRFDMKNVYVMPEGRTLVELKAKEETVKTFCALHRFIYGPRLHIELFGTKRGV